MRIFQIERQKGGFLIAVAGFSLYNKGMFSRKKLAGLLDRELKLERKANMMRAAAREWPPAAQEAWIEFMALRKRVDQVLLLFKNPHKPSAYLQWRLGQAKARAGRKISFEGAKQRSADPKSKLARLGFRPEDFQKMQNNLKIIDKRAQTIKI